MNGITDNWGETEDWVEIHNTSGSSIDLSGWHLSDKSGNLTKWQIPSASVPANGYLVVYCSGRDTLHAPSGELHPNFNLKQTQGEWIIIANSFGTVVDSIKIVHLTKMDHSVGRSTDGAIDWKLFTTPTPGSANTGAQEFYTPKVIMDIAPGFYPAAVNVTLTCAEATAQIRYTTDGTNPTAASTLYTGPVNIASTSVLRAIAIGVNDPSFIETNTYFINENHDIPVVSVCSFDVYDLIANGNQGGWGGGNFVGSFELFEQDGTFIDEAESHFNKHGNDSWAYDQRGFDMICRDQFGHNDDIDHQIFPEKTREDFQRLILKPGASDNYPFEPGGAHIRDAFVHTLSERAEMLLDERTWRPCVVYLNGEYWGIYELREKYDDHDYTDYYYDQGKFDLHYLKTWGGTWEEYTTFPEILGGPQQDWDDLTTFIMSNNMAPGPDFDYVKSRLKWASLCDYFMFNSYVVNQDWLNWNTAWWHGNDPSGSKLKWRYTLWDMDATFGHYINYTGIPDPTANADPCNAENLPDPGGQGHTAILEKLINENPEVEQYYITRYIDLVNTYFSCDYMNTLLDSMLLTISPEMPAHVAKWGGSVAGWTSNVQDLKDFIDARCLALEQGLIDCYDLTGPFDVSFDVSPANSGQIKVNSIWPPFYPWATQYYGGIETLTTAVPEVGFMFDHWEYTVGPMNNGDFEDTNGIMISQPEDVVAFFITEDPDLDGDGILNVDETGCLDQTNPDTDGDGLTDGEEVLGIDDPSTPLVPTGTSDPCDGCDPNITSPTCDSDGDGLYNADETGCLDENNADTDGDGLTDGEEVNGIDDPSTALVPTGVSDPCNPCDPDDTDISCQTDTDGDGVTDAQEGTDGTNINDPCSYVVASINPLLVQDPTLDCDGDGITDSNEIANGSDPFNPCDPDVNFPSCDTDGDGVLDSQEAIDGTDPNDPCSYIIASILPSLIVDPTTDCDEDGLTDVFENANGSDPFNPCDPDSSSIDCVDGVHIPTGFSPNGDDNNETYTVIIGKDVVSFTFNIYDRWGNKMYSSSEKGFTWDGSFNNEPCNSGVYPYVMEVLYENGTAELRSGNITLIR